MPCYGPRAQHRSEAVAGKCATYAMASLGSEVVCEKTNDNPQVTSPVSHEVLIANLVKASEVGIFNGL